MKMSNIINNFYVFGKSEDKFTFLKVNTGNEYIGDTTGLMRLIIKKLPQFSEQIKVLVSEELPFFYDPINNMIRVVFDKEVDISTIISYISMYVKSMTGKNGKVDMESLNDYCLNNNLSFVKLPNSVEGMITYISTLKVLESI